MSDLIADHISHISTTINKNTITNLISPSGSGKTIKLPIELSKGDNSIIVVETTKELALSAKNHIVDSYKNISVGNEIEGSEKIKYVSLDEMKKYMIKVLNNKTSTDLFPSNQGIIIIDQADIGSLDQYLIVSMWSYLTENSIGKIPRILLTSTTPIHYKNIQTLGRIDLVGNNGGSFGGFNDIGNNTTDIRYSDKNYPVLPFLDPENNKNNLLSDTVDLVYDIHNSSNNGDILIFCSDTSQVETIIQHITDMGLKNVDIFPIHSNLSQGEIDRLYVFSNNRKILVSDSTAETVFNISSVTTVIDMMIETRKELSLTGGQRHNLAFISKTRADIRASRVGNRYNKNNICYRMITSNLYNKLPNKIPHQIYRIPIHNILINLLEDGLSIGIVLNHILTEIFPKEIIDHTYKLLTRYEIIDINNNKNNKTDLIKNLPLGLRQSIGLYQWIQKKLPPYPGIILLTMIDVADRSYYEYPLRDEDFTHGEYNMELLNHYKTKYLPLEGSSDVHTYANIWNIMMDEVDGTDASDADIRKWCKYNGINYRNIYEVINISNEIINNVDRFENGFDNKFGNNKNMMIGPFDPQKATNLLFDVLSEVYHDKKLTLDKSTQITTKYIDENKKQYVIDDQRTVNNIQEKSPEIIYGLITSTIHSNRSNNYNTIICSIK